MLAIASGKIAPETGVGWTRTAITPMKSSARLIMAAICSHNGGRTAVAADFANTGIPEAMLAKAESSMVIGR
jgi:hypothetical protein